MSGYVVDLLIDVPKQDMDDLPVESNLLNKFVTSLREGLAKLNDESLDKFRQIDDELAQLRHSFPEVNSKICKLKSFYL